LTKAIADGYATLDETTRINASINADGKVLVEELEPCRQLIWDKIQAGEIQYAW